MSSFACPPPASPVVRRGSRLIIPAPPWGQPAILPPYCVKCGEPADGKPVTKTYYWCPPLLSLSLIVRLIIQKKIQVVAPLCARHARNRGATVMMAWLLPVIGVADAFILPRFFNVDGGIVALLASLLILAGLFIWRMLAYPIRPRFIDNFRGEFTGFCSAYLQRIPIGLVPATPNFGQPLPPPSAAPAFGQPLPPPPAPPGFGQPLPPPPLAPR